MTPPATLPQRLEIAPDGSNMSRVRLWAREAFGACFPKAPEAEGHAFVLAVHEAVRNVLEHAAADPRKSMGIEASREGRALVLHVTHPGRPFDGAAPPPAFDGSQDRGFGLYLMARGVTSVRYRSLADGLQQVELIKELEEEER